MKIYHYSKFLFSILFRKWSFWITTGLFILLLTLFWYVFPIVLKVDIFEVSTYKGLVMLLVLFLAISTVTTTVQIFRTGIDDGTDLLVLSKPISRVEMMWSKLITLMLTNLFISCVACFISIWIIFYPHDDQKIGANFILSTFVGTLINALFWSSVTIIFAILFKKFTAFVLVIGFQACLIVISLVCSLVIKSPNGVLLHDNHVSYSGLAVLSKQDANQDIEYDWGVVPVNVKKSTVINGDTKYKNQTLNQQGVNMSTLVKQIYNYGVQKSNDSVSRVIDLDFQLSMLLTFITNHNLEKMNANSVISGTESILEKMVYNSGIPISYSLLFSNQPKRDVSSDQTIEKINLNGVDFVLSSNRAMSLIPKDGSWGWNSNSFLPNEFGVFKHGFSNDSLVFPIYELNSEKTNFATKSFDNLDSFAQYYFGSEQIEKIQGYFNSHFNNANSNRKNVRARSYYETLMSIYTIQKYGYDMKNKKGNFKEKYINPMASLLIDFQYATYCALKQAIEEPIKYNWMTSHSLELMKSVLKIGPTDFLEFKVGNQPFVNLNKANWFNESDIFVGSIDDFKDYMTNNQTSKLVNSMWYALRAPFVLVPSNNLESFATVAFVNSYNIEALTLCWTFVSLIILAVGMNVYLRKDIA